MKICHDKKMRHVPSNEQASPNAFKSLWLFGAVWIVALGLMEAGCVTVRTVNVGERTALESQLMGPLEPLSLRAWDLNIVRDRALGDGIDAALQKEALRARRRQLYHRDDLAMLYAAGCMEHGADAKVRLQACRRPDWAKPEYLQALAEQENTDRQAIIAWLAFEDHSAGVDRQEIAAFYASRLSQNLKALPLEDGNMAAQ